MAACGLVLLSGIALAVRWRSYYFALPDWENRDARVVGQPGLQLCWLLTVGVLTGLAVGGLVIGPGGRLAMRLLAATSPEAEGLHTEAGFTIGHISTLGTIGFIVAVGIAFGVVVGPTFVFASFALPRGIGGGVLYGTALLVVFGSHIEPLRPGNEDFEVVGPSWLAVAAFSILAVLTGAVSAPVAGRIAAGLRGPRPVWAWWLVPVGLFTFLAFVQVPAALVALGLGSLAFLVATTNTPLRERLVGRGRSVLRVALAGVVLIAIPGFVAALDDILAAA